MAISSAAEKASTAAAARRDDVPLAAAATLPVTRALFDDVMVPCYAPAPFVPVRGGRGEVVAIRWMLRDVTDQRRAEREVIEAKHTLERRVAQRTAELENANQTKDRFLAALSHEMRTPLTPALATVAQLAARADLPADVRDELEVVRRNIELETRLIDDLLDLTRVAHEKLALAMAPVNVRDVVRAAADVCFRGQPPGLGTMLTVVSSALSSSSPTKAAAPRNGGALERVSCE